MTGGETLLILLENYFLHGILVGFFFGCIIGIWASSLPPTNKCVNCKNNLSRRLQFCPRCGKEQWKVYNAK